MPSNVEIAVLLGSIASTAAFGYAAYWALGIRRGLTIRLYRNQALGIGLLSIDTVIVFLLFSLAVAFDHIPPPPAPLPLTPLVVGWLLSQIPFQLLLFYQVDTSVLVARRSDPLLRDTFSWRRLRMALWPLFLGLMAVPYVISPGKPDLSLPWLILLVFSGGVVLPIAALRSKDGSLRKNLIWLAVSVVGFFISTVPVNFLTDIFQIVVVEYLTFIFVAYFFYRSARAMVPLNRI